MKNQYLERAWSVSTPYALENKFDLYCVFRAVVLNRAQNQFLVVIYQSDTVRLLFGWKSMTDMLEGMSCMITRQKYVKLAESMASRLEHEFASKGFTMPTPVSAQEIALNPQDYLKF